MNGAAYPAEIRRQRMLGVVRSRDYVRVTDLSEMFGISDVTARSDLDALATAGYLRRVRGGAVAAPPVPERSFEESLGAFSAQKRSIGAAAAAAVNSGDTVILDVGTTAAAVASALVARSDLTDVVVVTSGVNIALLLEGAFPRFTTIVTGGTLRPLQHSLVDPWATQIFDELHAAICFLGCNGVDLHAGVTNVNFPEASIKKRMLEAAATKVVVADGTKVGAVSVAHVVGIDGIDLLLTDSSADPARVATLRDAGLTIEVAG